MARIRTIKPEFWDSPSTAKASAVARLAYIAMWNWADDHGRGTANLKELEGFIFPNADLPTLSGGTSENFRQVMAEVSECFGVVFYEVGGRPYYAIPGWHQHQRNERSAKSKYPGPDEADTPSDLRKHPSVGTSENFRSGVAETPHTSVTGTGEQGNRGTGEQTLVPAPRGRATEAEPDGFADFYDAYPRKEKRRTAAKAYAAALRRTDPTTILAGAQRFAADPNLPERQYIPHPSTWLNGDGWDDDPLPDRRPSGGVARHPKPTEAEWWEQQLAAAAPEPPRKELTA